ncbi:MAG: hypothetical protein Q9163_001701 [Psora crenata]
MGAKTKTATLLEQLQPVPAIIGLVGSLIIAIVFTTSTWWSTKPDFRKVATALGAPIVMTVMLIISKIITRRRPVRLSNKRADLQRAIEELRTPKEEQKKRRDARAQADAAQSEEQVEGGSAVKVEVEENRGPFGPTYLYERIPLNGHSSASGVEPSSGAPSTSHRDQ